MKIPTKCNKCEKTFDLSKDLKNEDMKKKLHEIIKEKGWEDMLCEECRKK